MHIQATATGIAASTTGFSRFQRAIIHHSKDGTSMLTLVEMVRQERATHFPPKRIAEELTKMEAHGFITIKK